MKPAETNGSGARKRLAAMSGVTCTHCHHRHVISNIVKGRLLWTCAACSHSWEPTPSELQLYNGRVGERDRIAL